jgi:hypothetical protein
MNASQLLPLQPISLKQSQKVTNPFAICRQVILYGSEV